MQNLNIQKLTINDLDQLQKISKLTFHETFSEMNTEENMIKYLDNEFSTEKLAAELNDKGSEFYFAVIDDNVIGYLKINFGDPQTELQHDNSLEIQRIYILKEFHGKSVGQSLYNKAIDIAKQKAVDYVWLGVWQNNFRARSFYRKNGFIEFDKHIFMLGDDEQIDIMMKLQLKNAHS